MIISRINSNSSSSCSRSHQFQLNLAENWSSHDYLTLSSLMELWHCCSRPSKERLMWAHQAMLCLVNNLHMLWYFLYLLTQQSPTEHWPVGRQTIWFGGWTSFLVHRGYCQKFNPKLSVEILKFCNMFWNGWVLILFYFIYFIHFVLYQWCIPKWLVEQYAQFWFFLNREKRISTYFFSVWSCNTGSAVIILFQILLYRAISMKFSIRSVRERNGEEYEMLSKNFAKQGESLTVSKSW